MWYYSTKVHNIYRDVFVFNVRIINMAVKLIIILVKITY